MQGAVLYYSGRGSLGEGLIDSASFNQGSLPRRRALKPQAKTVVTSFK
jgi:hypothetical protein